MLCTSDANGVFAFQYLPANEPYVVFTPREVASTGLTMRTTRFQAGSDDIAIDLGDIAIAPGLRLAGRLVTPDGESPLEGVEIVFGRNPAWDLLSTKSDAEGRFELNNLPDQPLLLGFLHRNPAVLTSSPDGNSILYMGLRRTELEQQDIRLVFDPDIFMELPEIKGSK